MIASSLYGNGRHLRRKQEPATQMSRAATDLPAKRVLIAEHRDEVFARLAHDLGASGHVVFRATHADEVAKVYALADPCLAICNFRLPDGSGWLTATKLQMHRADARVWLYAPHKSTFDSTWAQLSGVERVLYYRGNLFRLADDVCAALLRSCTPKRRTTRRCWQESDRKQRWESAR